MGDLNSSDLDKLVQQISFEYERFLETDSLDLDVET